MTLTYKENELLTEIKKALLQVGSPVGYHEKDLTDSGYYNEMLSLIKKRILINDNCTNNFKVSINQNS